MNETEKRLPDDSVTPAKHDFGSEIVEFIDNHGQGICMFVILLLCIFPEVIPLFLGLVFCLLCGMLAIRIFIP